MQAEYERRRANGRQKAQAERQKAQAELALSRSIRQLHGVGQDAEAIARAVPLDPEQVRRALTGK